MMKRFRRSPILLVLSILTIFFLSRCATTGSSMQQNETQVDDVADIDVGTILLESLLGVQHSDIQDDVLMVKFDRQDVIIYIEDILGITSGDVTLTVTGELTDGTPFEGSDTIRVIKKETK